MHTLCLISDAAYAVGERICMARWVDTEIWLVLSIELWTNDGSVSAADAGAVMTELLPDLAGPVAALAP